MTSLEDTHSCDSCQEYVKVRVITICKFCFVETIPAKGVSDCCAFDISTCRICSICLINILIADYTWRVCEGRNLITPEYEQIYFGLNTGE